MFLSPQRLHRRGLGERLGEGASMSLPLSNERQRRRSLRMSPGATAGSTRSAPSTARSPVGWPTAALETGVDRIAVVGAAPAMALVVLAHGQLGTRALRPALHFRRTILIRPRPPTPPARGRR